MVAQTTESSVRITTIGDRVLLRDKRAGEVAFIGPIVGKTGTHFGIILDPKFNGDTNGVVRNISYFRTNKRLGIFVTEDKIKKSKRMNIVELIFRCPIHAHMVHYYDRKYNLYW